MNITIRPALLNEAEQLTIIMFAAKFYWNYPAEYKAIWKEELTITPEIMLEQDFYVAEVGKEIAGFYSILENKSEYYVGALLHPEGLWLENMFIHPRWIGKGIGHQCMTHLLNYCKVNNIVKFCFYADPHAIGFYERYGAELLGHYPSTIPGRLLPLYKIELNEN